MEFCMSSLGGNSGNLPAGPVAGVCWIGLLVMAFLARGGTDEVCGHYMASGQMGGGPAASFRVVLGSPFIRGMTSSPTASSASFRRLRAAFSFRS